MVAIWSLPSIIFILTCLEHSANLLFHCEPSRLEELSYGDQRADGHT